MEGNVNVVTAIVTLLGGISALLGFAGEATRIKRRDVNLRSNVICDYPTTPAVGLCIAATLVLVIAQVVIHVFGGCPCCRSRPAAPGKSWGTFWTAYIFSWIAFVVAFFLLTGAANANMRQDHVSHGSVSVRYCYYVKQGIAAGGGILALISTLLGVIHYRTSVSLLQSSEAGGGFPGQGIAMAQPQFPSQPSHPYPQSPAFVHEDTYARRQIP